MEKIGIVIPCYNERETITKLIKEIENVVIDISKKIIIIVVDDYSTDGTIVLLKANYPKSNNFELKVIQLQSNSGHQTAIYQGLRYVESLACNRIIIMDGDGEDDPKVIRQLIDLDEFEMVNVVRGKRRNSLFFKLFYGLFKLVFKIVTGKVLNFGHYCIINQRILRFAVQEGFISFPAFLLKVKAKKTNIISDRLKRLDGKSKMNFNGLVYHGFRAFSEFAEDFIFLILKATIIFSALFGSSILYIVYQKLFTDKAILGWASTLLTAFLNATLLCLGFFILGIVLLNLFHKGNINYRDKYKQIF